MSDFLVAIISYLGVIAGAVSGVITARRKDMDLVGACSVAFITALGGGTLRDMLLGRTPVFWVKESGYALVALMLALMTFYSTRLLRLTSKSILIPDALGLGMFSILGAEYALQSGTSMFVASLMGVITGVFGGVMRDVICNEIPVVFGRTANLYATCSFAGAWVYLLLIHSNFTLGFASFVGILVAVAMRILAVIYNLRLPDPINA
ncbi:MAG: hypothetical protein CVU39_25845 [Chloroflexi bacterium HGW-Chloroflexi-10]|nr:MAG: hypothetical protein CVU39_25845 [Chloroflexi bacterium HGW-Chloroflexi-10]